MTEEDSTLDLLNKIPEGYSEGINKSKKFSITKKIFNSGNSMKVFAQELGGNDAFVFLNVVKDVSLNYYITNQKEWLKPCEMDAKKVLDFLKHVTL